MELNFEKFISKNMKIIINEKIESNTCTAIFGNSGAGKSSILKIISGLNRISSGFIKFKNKIFDSKNVFLKPQDRKIGFIFQNYALIPNLNVKENILFGSKKQDKELFAYLINILNINSILKSKINNLSGGEAQRVGIARALIGKPEILLLDEPFSALDFKIKQKLIMELKNILEKLNITSILVSHDIDEVSILAKNVIHIHEGRVLSNTDAVFFLLNLLHNKDEENILTLGNIVQINSKSVKVLIKSLVLDIENFLDSKIEDFKQGEKVRLLQIKQCIFVLKI